MDMKESPISYDDYDALSSEIDKLQDEIHKNTAFFRLFILFPLKIGPEMNTVHEIQHKPQDLKNYQKTLVDQLKAVACSWDKSTAFIVHGLNQKDRINDAGPLAPKLAESILATDCPVSAKLTDSDRAALQKIAGPTKPSLTSTPHQ